MDKENIYVNPKLSESNLAGEDYFYFKKGQSLDFNFNTGINHRFLHLYGGELNYRVLNKYDLLYEEDSYGYSSSGGKAQFSIRAMNEAIIQATFAQNDIFKNVYDSCTVFNKNGILILLPRNKEYKTFKISVEAKYPDSYEDVIFMYSHGVIEKIESAPLPSVSGNGKQQKIKLKFMVLILFFFQIIGQIKIIITIHYVIQNLLTQLIIY